MNEQRPDYPAGTNSTEGPQVAPAAAPENPPAATAAVEDEAAEREAATLAPAEETDARPTPAEVPPPAPESAKAGDAAPVSPNPAAEAASPPAASDVAASSAAATAAHGIGVLLVNLGTPEAPEPAAVRRYLKEFLSDRRVIEKDSLLWRVVLNGFILPLRSRRKARDYKKIWNNEKNESPLKTVTRSQADKLGAALAPLGQPIIVDWAMRYGAPAIGPRLEALIQRGCDRILLMPLYPQYAAPTTATVCDEAFRYLMRLRHQPALRILPAYYEDPWYIEALASSLRARLQALPFQPEMILASYHGMPKEYVAKGDPYQSQCVRTTQLLRDQLGYDETRLMMTFQSRFGRARWLEPATIKTVKALAKNGVKNLVVLMPGFAADCLETLEEIAVDNARMFKRHGGQNFVALACLNDSDAGMEMIRQLATRELNGWA